MTKAMRDATLIAAGGTVKRTLADHFGGILNVKSFGAVADGVADDADALQATFDAAFGSANNPNSSNTSLNIPVYVPTGTYRVTKPLLMTAVDSGWVRGDGKGLTILVYDGPLGTIMPTFTAARTGSNVTSITIGIIGIGWPPGYHYHLSFSETGVSDRAQAHVIVDSDGRITQGSITLSYGGVYSVTPTVSLYAHTALLRTNGMRETLIEKMTFDMPAPTLANSFSTCVLLDRFKFVPNRSGCNINGDNFTSIATKNSNFGWQSGFSSDTGPQGTGTSSSSVTIGTGSKTFSSTYVTGGPVVSMRLRYTAASDSTKWVEGLITSVTGTGPYSVTINVDSTSGSGTFSSWNFSSNDYIGFNAMGSEMIFSDCDCTDHSKAGIYLCGQNVLSINVYGGVFTRIGDTSLVGIGMDASGGAALNNERGGSFAYVDGVTFIDSRQWDYYGEGATGVVLANITSTNTLGDNGGFNHGPAFGRFPQPVLMRNVKHTNMNNGSSQILFWLYEFGTIIEGCSFGYGQMKDHAIDYKHIYSRASTYQNSDPFRRTIGPPAYPEEET